MNNEVPLPTGYVAFDRLTFCSNILIGGGVPVRVKGYFPVLVGQGPEVPMIWLLTTMDGQKWQPVVERNVSLIPPFKVTVLGDKKSVQVVFIEKVVIIQATRLSETEAEVTYLDLRPVGVNVHGTASGLEVGTQSLSHNTFQGVAGMIDIG